MRATAQGSDCLGAERVVAPDLGHLVHADYPTLEAGCQVGDGGLLVQGAVDVVALAAALLVPALGGIRPAVWARVVGVGSEKAYSESLLYLAYVH